MLQLAHLSSVLEQLTREYYRETREKHLDLRGAGGRVLRAQLTKISKLVEFADDGTVIAGLSPDDYQKFVRDVPELDRAGLRQHVKDTGQLFDGVTVVPSKDGDEARFNWKWR